MFLETIRCVDGVALNLPYHQARLDRSLSTLNAEQTFNLKGVITPPKEGLFRCRFLYDPLRYTVEFLPYTVRSVASLKLVYDDSIEYPLKYADRKGLDALYELRGECDDVLIVKNALLRDTTIANIALRIDNRWLTPKNPLLAGTTRARLLEEGFVIEAELTADDIAKADRVAVMNAMVGFIEVENGIIA